MAGIGVVAGGVMAGTMSHGLAALLFQISPLDGLTYVGVAVLLLAAAAVSAIVPGLAGRPDRARHRAPVVLNVAVSAIRNPDRVCFFV